MVTEQVIRMISSLQNVAITKNLRKLKRQSVSASHCAVHCKVVSN